MSITTEQKLLVQSSFAKVVPIAETAAELFYNRLFEIEPAVKPLFKGDIKQQGRVLMQTLSVVVNGLNHLDTIVPAIQDLSRRHVNYGVVPAHYQMVGAALLWTLEQGLGDEFTPEVKEAWTTAYTLIADTAIAAGYSNN